MTAIIVPGRARPTVAIPAPGPPGVMGHAGLSTVQRIAATAISYGVVCRLTTGQEMTPALTSLRTMPFHALSLGDVGSGAEGNFHVVGPVPADVLQLGAGAACAVGVDINGVPVRATDPDCVSAPNWLGSCDALGNVVVAPRRDDVLNALDFGLKGDGATDNSPLFSAMMDLIAGSNGATVYFPSGTYRFNSRVGAPYSTPGAIPMGTTLLGNTCGGALNVVGATIFDFYNAGTAIRAAHDIVQRTLGTGVTIRNIRLRGRKVAGAPTFTMVSSAGSPSPTIKGQNGTATSIRVKTIGGGVLGTATFQYSLDNGSTWSSTITTPVHTFGPSFAIPFKSTRLGTTELFLNFPPGTYQAADATFTTATIPASDVDLTLAVKPTITIHGDAAENYTGRIRISTGGTVGVLGAPSAYFQLSIDGGATWGTAQPVYAEVILFPTGQLARFAAGTYSGGDVYPTWTAAIPDYNRIGIEVILGAEVWIRDCVISGFKYGVSNDGSELVTVDHVSTSAVENEASDGYQDLISDIGLDSAVGVRYTYEVSGVSGNTNGHIVNRCQFSASMYGTSHEDGVDQAVTNCNYEVPGGLAILMGGQNVMFQNCTSEGATKAAIYCRRKTGSGNASTYFLTLSNVAFNGRADVPLIDIDGLMAIVGLSLDQVNAQAAPSTGAVRNSQLITGAWVGNINLPVGVPVFDNYQAQLNGRVGTTINHYTLPRAALDVCVVDFSVPTFLYSSDVNHKFNERRHTANNEGVDFSSDRVFHGNTARVAAEDAKVIAHHVFVAGVATADIAPLTPPQYGSGQVWITVQFVRPDDHTKMASYRVRQKYQTNVGVTTLLGAPVIEYAEDLDGSFVAPVIVTDGTTVSARTQAHPTRDADVMVKTTLVGVGL